MAKKGISALAMLGILFIVIAAGIGAFYLANGNERQLPPANNQTTAVSISLLPSSAETGKSFTVQWDVTSTPGETKDTSLYYKQ